MLEPQVGSAAAALAITAAIIDSLACGDRFGIVTKHPEQEHASYQALPLLQMDAASRARARAAAQAISRQQVWGFSAQGLASGIAAAEQQLHECSCPPGGSLRRAVVCIATARFIRGGPRAQACVAAAASSAPACWGLVLLLPRRL